MSRARRIVSSLLLAAGIILVFGGLHASLGYSLAGFVASGVAIAALLYAGGAWFGSSPAATPSRLFVFDRALVLTSGEPLLAAFPETFRPDVRASALAALGGERLRFVVGGRSFLATPLVSETGAIVYGAFVEGVTANGRPTTADV